MLQWILVILLLLVVMYIAVLLLVACGAVTCVWRLLASARCLRGKPAWTKAVKKFRSCVADEHNEDVVLQHAATNLSYVPDDCTLPLTCLVMEVDKWRALWVHEAETMSRVMRHYQRCVRQSVVKNQCYEMLCVEGLFVVVCATVDAAVNVACDVVRDVAGLATGDAKAVAAVYSRCGCSGSSVTGLRLRTAVHNEVANRHIHETGRVLWCGGAIVNAVRAASVAGEAGMVVLTASAEKLYTGSTPLHPCGRLGHEPESEELFAALILGDETPDVGRDNCTRTGGNAEAALYLIEAGSEAGSAPSRDLCKEILERHYWCIAECDRLDDLKWMSQRFGLRNLQQSEGMDEHRRYASLLNDVSHHLGSVMECLHGVSRPSRQTRGRVAIIDDCDQYLQLKQCGDGGKRFKQARSLKPFRSFRRETLLFFAYAKQREED